MLLTFNQKYGSLWTVKPKKLLKLQASQSIQSSRKIFRFQRKWNTLTQKLFQFKNSIISFTRYKDMNIWRKNVISQILRCSQTWCPLITYKRITFWRWNPIFLCHITFISANKLSSRTWLSKAAVSLLPTVNNNNLIGTQGLLIP